MEEEIQLQPLQWIPEENNFQNTTDVVYQAITDNTYYEDDAGVRHYFGTRTPTTQVNGEVDFAIANTNHLTNEESWIDWRMFTMENGFMPIDTTNTFRTSLKDFLNTFEESRFNGNIKNEIINFIDNN